MDDPSYKLLLEHQRIVKDLLIGFIAPRRPSGWAAALDFDTLREGATENVTDELRRRLGDVVWSIDRRDGRGGVQTLHLLLEHQLSVDYSMPLRFLNYTSLLYQRLYRPRTKWRKWSKACTRGPCRSGCGSWGSGSPPRGAGADQDLRPVAWRAGTEVGRGVAIDPRVRGGKRSVGEQDRSLGSGNPAARHRAGYRAGVDTVAPLGGAAVRCGGSSAAGGGARRSDGRGPSGRSGGVDRRLRHDRRLPRPRGPRRLVARPCGACRVALPGRPSGWHGRQAVARRHPCALRYAHRHALGCAVGPPSRSRHGWRGR